MLYNAPNVRSRALYVNTASTQLPQLSFGNDVKAAFGANSN